MSDFDDAPYPASVKTRGPGVIRHLASIVISLVTVPLAYLALDRAGFLQQRRVNTMHLDNVPVELIVWLAVGAGLLFLAAAAGRLAGSGPLLAALVWGVLPTLIALVKVRTMLDAFRHLDFLYDQAGFWLTSAGAVLFAAVTALLIGGAVSGRWRRTPVA